MINFANVFFRSQDMRTAFGVLKSMMGLNGHNLEFLTNQSYFTILILISSFAICLLFKNTNFLIENFNPTNTSKDEY